MFAHDIFCERKNRTKYIYDGNGNLTNINSNIGSQALAFDELNRPTQIVTSSGSAFNFNFDDVSRLTKITRPGSQTDFSYNPGGTIAQIVHSSNGATKSFVQYSYDLRNFPIQKRNMAGVLGYSYDLNGQLTNVAASGGFLSDRNESFSYDSIGNRLTDQNGNYVYDQTSQRLKEDYQYFYSYDNNGNLTAKVTKDLSKDSFSYSYSSSNQLTGIKINQGLSGPIKKEIYYQYDVLGRRMQKDIIDHVQAANSYTRKYVYNGDNIFAEYDGANNLLAKYTHSLLTPDDILEAEITSSGVQSGLSKSAGKYQYFKDALGTVTDIVSESGNIVQSYDYSAYGKILGIKDSGGSDITSSPSVNTSFTYTGREFDQESGMYYYRARYYDSNLGRFLQQDPDPGRYDSPISIVNRYTYVENKPTLFRDPKGQSIFGDLLSFGHHLISDFGSAFDKLIKDPGMQAAIVIFSAAFISPAALTATLGSVAMGAMVAGVVSYFSGNRSWEAFAGGVKDFISDPIQIRNAALLGLGGFGLASFAGAVLHWAPETINQIAFGFFFFSNSSKLKDKKLRLSNEQTVVGTIALLYLGVNLFGD